MTNPSHPFVHAPNRVFVRLSVPVLFSLIAEPLTGLADTAFVARLGAAPLAGLGVGAAVLSSTFWVFNFLGIGTQTEVAQGEGRRDRERVSGAAAQALILSALLGALVLAAGWVLMDWLVRLMGAEGPIVAPAKDYIAIRLWGSPAVLATVAAFGALRGLQDMRTPLWVATGVNALNIALDPLLIFGLGPFPRLEVAGAAAASVLSQWLGAVVAVALWRVGLPHRMHWFEFSKWLRIGGDLFVRTAALNVFLLLATRAATKIGPDAGAAHQAIRQVWSFTALFLDTFAITGQSLVAYFLGAGDLGQARRVARIVCEWSLGTGLVLAAAMLLGREAAARAFVPPTAHALFYAAWVFASLSMPINALSFGTDGIHWGAGDFRYLRNAVLMATAVGVAGIAVVDSVEGWGLTAIWLVTAGWITVRAGFGIVRIWPGLGKAPLVRAGEV